MSDVPNIGNEAESLGSNDLLYVAQSDGHGGYVDAKIKGSKVGSGTEEYILMQHQETSGTDGGTATSGSWETGTLNAKPTDTGSNCTLSSNAFTLSAGTYRIYATSPFLATNSSKMKLRNTSDSTDVLIGTNDHADSGGSDNGVSIVAGQFTISSSKTFEMQRRVQTTKATNGYGVLSGFSVTEVYLQVELWKEKSGGSGGALPYIQLRHTETSTTDGGGSLLGAWRTLPFDDETSDTGNHCTLSADQFTLDAGTYRIKAYHIMYNCQNSRVKLYNITDVADEIVGTNHYDSGATAQAVKVEGEFTIATAKTFELQYRSQVTIATNGLGTNSGWGTEIYGSIELWKRS